jgi:hypothetical protein
MFLSFFPRTLNFAYFTFAILIMIFYFFLISPYIDQWVKAKQNFSILILVLPHAAQR